jgi:uncharacterized radical SAM superfamily protein
MSRERNYNREYMRRYRAEKKEAVKIDADSDHNVINNLFGLEPIDDIYKRYELIKEDNFKLKVENETLLKVIAILKG